MLIFKIRPFSVHHYKTKTALTNQIQQIKQKFENKFDRLMQAEPFCSYFLFINSGSGGGLGQKLIEQQKAQKITFDISLDSQNKSTNKKVIDVYFFNLRTSRQKGFGNLKILVDKNYNVKVIICGGDGTVMWVISELTKYNIDTEMTPLGIIPLGTGNDFSQYLGWGKRKTSLIQNSFASLKKMIRKWEKAKIDHFDIWDVKAEVYEYGKFQKVQNTQNQLIEGKTFEKSFCNYFSFGLDGKIGYSFDMHRTQSRLGNLAMYGILGLVKAMTKTKTLSSLVHGLQIRQQLNYDFMEKQSTLDEPPQSIVLNLEEGHQSSAMQTTCSPHKKQKKDPALKSFVFKTKNSKQQITAILLKNDYQNIVFLNINSFMGGVFDIWKNAKIGIETEESKNFTDMASGDGKLELISFPSSLGMAAERTFGGFAERISQGEGPYFMQFKKYDQKEKHRTYLQVDGQFVRFTHPKSVLIRRSVYGRNGKVKVLRNIGGE